MSKDIKRILHLVKSLRESQEQFLLLFPDNKKIQGKLEAYKLIENSINIMCGDKDGKN